MSRQGSTTFILGAGASLQAGYPSVILMGSDLLEWMRRPRAVILYDFAESADALEQRFGNNIEAILGGIHQEIERRGPDRAVFANLHRPALTEAMRQWFAEIHRQHPALAYEQFATDVVKPGDRIISFNYDVSLDSQLCRSGKWCVGDGYGFPVEGLPCGSAVSIIKLHGSINWLALLSPGMAGMFNGRVFGDRPAFCDDDLSALGYVGLADKLFPRAGSAAIPPLILPTSRKRFYFQTNQGREWENFWARLWRKARRAVCESARVVICGYGMQPIDRRGCNLLLKGTLEADVSVCCGSDSAQIVQKLRANGRRAQPASEPFFETWVSSQAQRQRHA